MSEIKAEIKIATVGQIGSKIDDAVEAATKELHSYEGAEQALKQAIKSLEGLNAHVDKDLDEGKLEDMGPLQVAESIKRYIARCMGLVQNLATTAEVTCWKARGKVEALNTQVKILKGMYDAETAKLEGLRKAKDSGSIVDESGEKLPVGRVPGVHPGDPLADRRADVAEQQKE